MAPVAGELARLRLVEAIPAGLALPDGLLQVAPGRASLFAVLHRGGPFHFGDPWLTGDLRARLALDLTQFVLEGARGAGAALLGEAIVEGAWGAVDAVAANHHLNKEIIFSWFLLPRGFSWRRYDRISSLARDGDQG